MPHTLPFLSVLCSVALATLATPRTANACDPAISLSPYDLADRAERVVLAEITRSSAFGGPPAQVTVTEVFKGVATPPGGVELVHDAAGSTCEAGLVAGRRGVLFLDAAGRTVGLYASFQTDPAVIGAVALYLGGSSAAERGARLVDLAVGRAWTASYDAARALADRPELLAALDSQQRRRIIARLRKVSTQSPLALVAARLRDPEAARVLRRRGFDRGARDLAKDRFEAVVDVAVLATTVETATQQSERTAAMDRCERVWGRRLGTFTHYSYRDDHPAELWRNLAAACRTGVRDPAAP